MTFDVVWISHLKDENGRDEYRAFAECDGRTGSRFFADKEEMAATLNAILESQKTVHPSADELLKRIEAGSVQFFGSNALDLTSEQARMLGWI